MFHRFSDAARRVVVLMQDEARKLGQREIGTEHLLLAVLRVVPDLLGLSPDRVRTAVGAHRPRDPSAAEVGHLPFTADTKRVFEGAAREAGPGTETKVEPRHLVLAALRLDGCGAVTVLRGLDVDPAATIAAIESATPAVPPHTDLAVRVELLESRVRSLTDEVRPLRARLD